MSDQSPSTRRGTSLSSASTPIWIASSHASNGNSHSFPALLGKIAILSFSVFPEDLGWNVNVSVVAKAKFGNRRVSIGWEPLEDLKLHDYILPKYWMIPSRLKTAPTPSGETSFQPPANRPVSTFSNVDPGL